jgi:L-fuconolactonase
MGVNFKMTTASDADSSKILEPELPIIDSHHHLWVTPHYRYLIEEFVADLATGHNVVSTMYIECGAMYRKSGPQRFRSVGEAEFVTGMAAMSDSGGYGPTRICEGFVGNADLTLGEAVDEVIEALASASMGRLRGIRMDTTWDADPAVSFGTRPPKGLMLSSAFRAGFTRLGAYGLSYDTWQYHPQIPEICDLADAFPNAPIIVDHCGGVVGVGPYREQDIFGQWKPLVSELARRPNVTIKLGGLGGRRSGFGYENRKSPATAQELAADWRPYIQTCIELFGPDRCMFESNFSVDRLAGSYATVWNAFKLIAAKASDDEKAALFSGTARRAYRLKE